MEDPAELETSILIKLSQHMGKNASCAENAIIEESTFFFFFKLLIQNTSLPSSLCFLLLCCTLIHTLISFYRKKKGLALGVGLLFGRNSGRKFNGVRTNWDIGTSLMEPVF